MGNKGVGSLLSAGGGGAAPGPQAPACRAFGAAVDAYCPEAVDERRGTFNDYFFEALTKDKPEGTKLAESIAGDDKQEKAPAAASIAAAVASGTGLASEAARRVMQTAAATGKPAHPLDSASTWKKLGAAWLSADVTQPAPRYPAGKLEHQPITVKAPEDTYEPGKLEEYQSVEPDSEVVEVGCEACGEDCEKGNKCC